MNKDLLDDIKAKHPNRIKKLGETLDDPILSPYPFYCFLADRDPTADEPLVYHDYDGLILFWVNETTKEISVSTDNLAKPLAWDKIFTSRNSSVNTPRAWQTISLAFNTPRTPSATRDTDVLAIVNLTSTLVIPVGVNAVIDSVIRGTESISGVAATTPRTLAFTVPAGSSYQLTDSGAASIILVSELPS